MTGSVAVVTGGSRGIGAAAVARLRAAGHIVLFSYRSDAESARTVADANGAVAIRADVSVEDDVIRLFETADELGSLRVLVNNAGIVDVKARVAEVSAERVRRLFDVNVLGPFLCCREAVRRMTSGAVIVNVSSVASRLGGAGQYVDYAATKGAVDTLTIGLAQEVATEGIRVNGVRPGIIDTDIHASGGDPGRAGRLAPVIPMGRPGTADEVAAAIAWLCSAESSYATGAILDVSGGR